METATFVLVVIGTAVTVTTALIQAWKWRDRRSKVAGMFTRMEIGNGIERKRVFAGQETRVAEWAKEAEGWMKETDDFLKTCSVQASIAFLTAGAMPTATFYNLADGARQTYFTLLWRLQNLKDIMERPDVYC